MNRLFGMLGLLLACLAITNTELWAVTLVKEGKPQAVIIIPVEPTEDETLAQTELIEYLEKMSGAKVPSETVELNKVNALVKKSQADGHVPILIGRAAGEKAVQQKGEALPRGSLVLDVAENKVLVTGPEEGTYYSAIEILEQLGCRWFMPGDLGMVIPKRKTIELAQHQTVQIPSFESRWFQMPDKDWQKRNRCGGPYFPGAHGLPVPKVKMDKATGEITPAEFAEFFALNNGKRTTRQHCLSNPDLLKHVIEQVKLKRSQGKGPIIGMGPNDGGGFCECEKCKALDSGDYDPFSGDPSVTDRYIWFFNQVLAGVDDEYPDTKLAFYIYHSYMRPPKKHKPDQRIMGALAPIALDRVHGFSNPISPEKSYAKGLYRDWGKLIPGLYDRGYWSNLACPGFPFIIVHRLRDEIPACHEIGLAGWRVETFPNYGPQFPSMYVASKLMWNHETDVDALLADCYDKFFGPAAEPMGRYISLMNAALRDGDYITGCSWDMPHFYTPEIRKEARSLLNAGLKASSGKGIYEDRTKMIVQTFDMLEAFIHMMDARVEVDFIKAKEELDKLDAVAEKLMSYEPTPMVSAGRFSTYVNYMRRFFRPCTEQGWQRVTGGNELLAATKDEWDFQIDPAVTGEEIGLYKEGITGGNWQRIKTSSSSWSNQGLRYYKGLAWYRQKVELPESAKDRRVFLWCGGVDELAKVWVNGKQIGISHGASFYPFEMDATDAVKPGENVITICVSNERVNELGTGGIVAPVILYAPAKGKDAVLENVRDLKPTFP